MKKENGLRCEIALDRIVSYSTTGVFIFNFETCSSGYTVNFKKVNAGWD